MPGGQVAGFPPASGARLHAALAAAAQTESTRFPAALWCVFPQAAALLGPVAAAREMHTEFRVQNSPEAGAAA